MRPLPLISAKETPRRRSGTLARSLWKLEGADKLRRSSDGCAVLVSLSFLHVLTSSGRADPRQGRPDYGAFPAFWGVNRQFDG